MHGTPRHPVLGYEEVKQPFFGGGTRAMPLCQSCKVFVDGGAVIAGGGVWFGVCARPSGCQERGEHRKPMCDHGM